MLLHLRLVSPAPPPPAAPRAPFQRKGGKQKTVTNNNFRIMLPTHNPTSTPAMNAPVQGTDSKPTENARLGVDPRAGESKREAESVPNAAGNALPQAVVDGVGGDGTGAVLVAEGVLGRTTNVMDAIDLSGPLVLSRVLPRDILSAVLDYSTMGDLVRISRTCHWLNEECAVLHGAILDVAHLLMQSFTG